MTDSLKIALIHDNPRDLFSLKACAEEALPDAQVMTAQDGPQGLDLARSTDPDVILLDIALSDMDGIELAQRLKADDRTQSIPVLFVTGAETERARRTQAVEVGADGFLAQPVDDVELAVQLRAMAKIKAANLAARQEQTVNESRSILDQILDTVPQAIFWKDREGRYLGCNASFAASAGLSDPAQIVGKTDFDLPWLPPQAEGYRADDREVLENNHAKMHIIEPITQADGRQLWVDTSKIPLTNADGRPYAVLGIYEDITQRRQSETVLNNFFELHTNLNLIAHLDGTILRANQAWEQVLGYTKAELESTNFLDLVHPEDQAATRNEMSKLSQGVDIFDFENRYRHKNGEYRQLAWSALVPMEDKLIYAVASNITDRVRAESALQESETGLRKAQAVANVGSWVWYIQTNQLKWSDQMYQIFGIDKENFSGDLATVIDEAIHPDDRAAVDESNRSVAMEGKPIPLEYRVIRPDGSVRVVWAEAGELVLDSAGTPYSLSGIVQDITERKRVEAALNENRDLLARLTAQVPGVVYQYRLYPDGHSCFPYSSPGIKAIYDVTPEEVREDATPVFERLHPDDYDDVSALIQESARTQQLFHSEFRVILPGQGVRWRLCDAQPQLLEDGSTLWHGIISDITDRKLAEFALHESEARFRTVVETDPDAVFIQTQQRFAYLNPAAVALFGAPGADHLLGAKVADYFHPDNRAIMQERLRRLTEDRQALPLAHQKFLRFDGTGVDVEVSAVPFVFQEKEGGLVFARDITDRVQAEKEREEFLTQIQAQAQQITQIMNTVPEGVVLLDGEGLVLTANPTGEVDLGALANAGIGQRITQLGDLPLVDLMDLSADRPWREAKIDSRIFEAIARPIVAGPPHAAHPTPDHWVLVINEVTQARSLNKQFQQQERLAVVGQLAAGIAHDFNNILAVIAMHTSLISRANDLSDRVRERLTVINEQTTFATRLVQQLLDFSRHAALERQPLDMRPLLKEQVKLLADTLPESIQVLFDSEPGEYVVRADLTRIRQALMNLAVNARDAMPEGGTLRLTLTRQETSPAPDMGAGPWVCIQMTDSGVGLTPDVIAHIFEPFFTTKPHGQGTGLGLAQVHGIIKQHEGEIKVVSSVGQGTTFSIYLPAMAISAPIAVAPPGSETTAGGGETILIVEDNLLLRDAMCDILEGLGYAVVTAKHGEEALDVLAAQGEAISLVLSDLSMPVMGGLALLSAMRARGITLPLVILSGHAPEGKLDQLKEQGLAGWLLKPPDIDDLTTLLAQILNNERS